MPVNRFEQWTRKWLEGEARKHGVRDPEVLSHAELLKVILRDAPRATQKGLRSARRLVGTLIDVANAALPSAREYRPPSAAEPHWRQRPGSGPEDPSFRPPTWPEPRTAEDRPVAAPEQPASWAQSAGDAAEPSWAPTGDQAAPQPSWAPSAERAGEPSWVPTQARRDAGWEPTAAPGPQPTAAEEEASTIEQTRLEPDSLQLRWHVTESGAARARALLGAPGELAIRLVSVRADPGTVVQSDVTEHGPVERAGEWTAQLAGADVHCVTAVGLRAAGRFVSIAHGRSQPQS
jgi:hypothetical protein